jgi:hypothetical protein
MWKLISRRQGRTLAVLVRKLGYKEDIWAQEGRDNRSWKELLFEKLHDWYPSRNEICVIKSIRMGWLACGMYWGHKRYIQGFDEEI